MKKLSFCITCKNRLYQIRETLPVNLIDNKDMREELEFVLLDFVSTDGLNTWVMENFRDEIDSGYLRYILSYDLSTWHSSIAKNIAHRQASGGILVNLDADNYTGKNGGLYVLNQFEKYGEKLLLHQFSGKYFDGSHGRIALLNKYFYEIGGYDEGMLPTGNQDVDIINRLTKYGLKYVSQKNRSYNQAIANTKEEGIKNTNLFLSYDLMNKINFFISLRNIGKNKLIANQNSEILYTKRKKYKLGISIIISLYNASKHIKKCISSILQQSYKDFEIIVVDCGSTDGTLTILYSFKDSRIRIISSSKKWNSQISYNIGINISLGKYICIAHAENIYFRSYLNKQFNYLERHKYVGATLTDSLIINKQDNPVWQSSYIPYSSTSFKVEILTKNGSSYNCLMIRYHLLKKYKLKYEATYIYGEDYHLLMQCVHLFPVVNIDELLFASRDQFSQLSLCNSKKRYTSIVQIKINELRKFNLNFSPKQFKLCTTMTDLKEIISKSDIEEGIYLLNCILNKNEKLKLYDQNSLCNTFNQMINAKINFLGQQKY